MEISRSWRLQKFRYRLIGVQCEHCGEKIFPPKRDFDYYSPEPKIKELVEPIEIIAQAKLGNEELVRV